MNAAVERLLACQAVPGHTPSALVRIERIVALLGTPVISPDWCMKLSGRSARLRALATEAGKS